MLVRGNQKLGPSVWSWSLPVGQTCPGASEVCELLCYAKRGRFRSGNVQRSHQLNLVRAMSHDFVTWMLGQLQEFRIGLLRIHVAGDFFDELYIRQWREIVSRRRQTQFYAYTRSWAERPLLPRLVELSQERNMLLYFSWDRSMPRPPEVEGIRTCYLSEHDNDLPGCQTDLVFRDNPDTVMKFDPDGNQVCPFDNGITPVTCSSCRLCWTDRTRRKRLDRLAPTPLVQLG